MAIAEYRFYEQQNYPTALEAYEKVLKHPKSTLYDLALFKTAWCYWKLGDTTKSALRFKDVLDLAKKKAGRTEAQQRRAEELQGEALEEREIELLQLVIARGSWSGRGGLRHTALLRRPRTRASRHQFA